MTAAPAKVGQELTPAMVAYLVVLGLAGVGVMIGTYLGDWGFWGWFGGGFLVVAGFGALLGNVFKIGWQPAVGPCPRCGTSLHYLTKKQHLRCPSCETLLEVQGQSLAAVPQNAVADTAEYPAPYVASITFPPTCALCGQPPAQAETVRWDKHRKKADYVVATVIEVTKIVLQVPVCAAHVGQGAVALDYGDHPSTQHDGVCVKFRSVWALEGYRRHNAAVMPPIRNEPQMPHAPSA
ncbi:MAG: hypothetical protein KC731_01830 [Myxococcales bacterium]|nr:hypothetical protein [Myxococcales bacterium]